MGALSELEPKRVFYYFEEITKIPHGSYNVDRISDYIANFGRSHNLETYQDAYKNVIMIKEASEGYENEPPIILQGHMDMVAVHRPDYEIDMKTEGLKACVNTEEGYVYAEGTSLGGDDGIAVAYALAILEDDTLKHPRLEVVITTNEETGMEGARGIDLSMLKGSRLLNLDSEEEGIFLTSCAGGLRGHYSFDSQTEKNISGIKYSIKIFGLLGGHSGEEIDKGRANSNKLAARLLYSLSKKLNVHLLKFDGGVADNAIPRETAIEFIVSNLNSNSYDQFTRLCADDIINSFAMAVKKEFHSKDPGFNCAIGSTMEVNGVTAYKLDNAIKFLHAAPDGVMAMSGDVEGLVELSLNMGIVKFDVAASDSNAANHSSTTHASAYAASPVPLSVTFALRSSNESEKAALADRLSCLCDLAGGRETLAGDYPGWEFRPVSPLREKMIALYENMYGKTPEVKAIHAGLECGLLAGKINDLDGVSIGPDMKDIHTSEEKLYIASVARVYEYVTALLAMKD